MTDQKFMSLGDRVIGHARDFPDLRAFVCDEETLTYKQLYERALAVAGRLQSLGFSAGGDRRVGVISANSSDYAIIIIACQIAGIAIVPLPGLIAPDALARMIDNSNATIVFYDKSHDEKAVKAGAISALGQGLTLVDIGKTDFPRTSMSGLDRWAASGKARLVPVHIDSAWTSDVIYSSGTTGIPKGIVQSFGGRSAQNISLATLGMHLHTKFLHTVGLYSNFGMVGFMLTLWWAGTFFSRAKFSAAATIQILRDEKPGMAWFAPATLVRTIENEGFQSAVDGNSCVKLCAGAPLSRAHKKEVLSKWSGPFFDLYGQTETGTLTLLPIHAVPESKFGSVGSPLSTVRVRIIDENGLQLPVDVEGEIAGHSSTLMSGYHKRDDANSAAFWRDANGSLYIRTGDVGKIDSDGYLWLCDRKKDMIISGGYNIYPSDIEGILQEHPAVFEVAVVGCPSTRWGETPVAFLTLRESMSAGEDELREWVNGRLGKIQRVAAVKILPNLPSGTMGKILKRELRDKFAASMQALP